MTVVMLRKQGNSVGLTFPAETRIRMGLEVGQELTLVELADGVKLVKRNLALERQLRLAEPTQQIVDASRAARRALLAEVLGELDDNQIDSLTKGLEVLDTVARRLQER